MEDKNWLDKNGRIDFETLEEGARRSAEERAEQHRIIREKELAKQQAKQAERDALMAKFADRIQAENKAKADAAILEEIAQAEAEIKINQNKLHNIKEDTETDKAFRFLLQKVKGND